MVLSLIDDSEEEEKTQGRERANCEGKGTRQPKALKEETSRGILKKSREGQNAESRKQGYHGWKWDEMTPAQAALTAHDEMFGFSMRYRQPLKST